MSQTDKSTTDKERPILDSRVIEQAEAEREIKAEVYACPECQKSFDNENSLKMHMLRSHHISPREGKPRKREAPEAPKAEERELVRPKIKPQEIPVKIFGGRDGLS